MAESGKFGFFCPHCRKEIVYDKSYYNKKIAELGAEVSKIQVELANYKASGIKNEEWRRKAIAAQQIKNAQLTELRAYRAAANTILQDEEMKIFLRILKEEIGETRWIELHKTAEKELEHGSAFDDMKSLYVNAEGKIIRKV